jgi:hypothetical protein
MASATPDQTQSAANPKDVDFSHTMTELSHPSGEANGLLAETTHDVNENLSEPDQLVLNTNPRPAEKLPSFLAADDDDTTEPTMGMDPNPPAEDKNIQEDTWKSNAALIPDHLQSLHSGDLTNVTATSQVDQPSNLLSGNDNVLEIMTTESKPTIPDISEVNPAVSSLHTDQSESNARIGSAEPQTQSVSIQALLDHLSSTSTAPAAENITIATTAAPAAPEQVPEAWKTTSAETAISDKEDAETSLVQAPEDVGDFAANTSSSTQNQTMPSTSNTTQNQLQNGDLHAQVSSGELISGSFTETDFIPLTSPTTNNPHGLQSLKTSPGGHSTRPSVEPSDIRSQWTNTDEQDYATFVETENEYLSQGNWDQWPVGSRLFIGK